jgi:hypothetical protein
LQVAGDLLPRARLARLHLDVSRNQLIAALGDKGCRM